MKKILLVENYGSDFFLSRISYAVFLQNLGYEVYAFIPNDGFVEKIKKFGIRVFPYEFERKDKGPIQIIKLAKLIRGLVIRHEIDIIHSFRFQPNIINILANFLNKRHVVLHVTGLGIAFSVNTFRYRLYRIMSQFIFGLKFLFADRIIFQNEDDPHDLWFSSIATSKIRVVLGSGVNIEKFKPDREKYNLLRSELSVNEDEILFLCVTRLIWEKGIRELVEAFEFLSDPKIKLLIAGVADYENPRHIPDEFVASYAQNNQIQFLGHRDDIPDILAAADVFIYPSYYREGIPRSILEALSTGLPIITSNTPGCSLTVQENLFNGILIDHVDTMQIVDSILFYMGVENKIEMGQNSRKIAENVFSTESIFNQIEKVYRHLKV